MKKLPTWKFDKFRFRMWWRMGKQNKQILALFILIQCIITSKDGGSVNAVSLWGNTVDFMQKDCSYWELENKHTIPSLKEVSVCVNIKRKLNNSGWTVFMYLHPNKKHIELGMKGYGSELHIIMFDRVWVSPPVVSLANWHSVCMTWSQSMIKPKVYVNETMVDLKPESNRTVLHPQCCTVAHGGTLTLGVAHSFVMGKLEKETGTELKGSLSLFRMWKRARSAEEISEMTCADGDVLHWEERIWNKVHNCQPVQDVTQQCEWSHYEVNLVLIISREDGHKTNVYDAQVVAFQWLTKAFAELQWLPGIHLHKVEVFHLRGSHTGFSGNAEETVAQMATIPGLSQFQCLAQLTAIPGIDVGKMQDELSEVLAKSHKIDYYEIFTNADFIFVYPLDAVLPNPETSPPITTSLPGTTETITSTMPQPMTTTTEMITTLGTTPIQMETSTAFHSSSTVTTTITSSTPFMETTLAESSSKTVLSSTTTLTFNTNSTVSTVSPDGIMSDSFFNVNINVTIEGPGEPETIIQTWLYETLTCKGIHVLNFKLMSATPARRQSVERNSFKGDTKSSLLFSVRHSCVFHAQVITSSITETQEHIHSLLEKSYSNGSVHLDARPEDILISHIKTGPCPEHNHYTRQGLFKWPQIGAQRITSLSCEGNPEKTAYRQCFLDAESSSALWKSPDLGQCQVVVYSVSDLEDITVTHDNAEDILLMIEDLIRENKDLDEYELSTVLSKLADVINVSMITPPLGEVILNITSDILESHSNLLPFTNSILNITESVGDQMFGFSGGSVSLTSSALAISVVNIDQGNFHNLTFGVSSTNKGFNPEIYINQEPFDDTVAFFSLPSEVQERFPIANGNSPRIQFQFYCVPNLFQTKGDPDGKTLITFVVSASVTNATRPIENLKEYVAFTLHHLTPKTKYQDVHCVFWDFNKNDGYGGWNPKGCWTYNVSEDYTTCQCDHMTHFGVLVDVSRTPIDEKNERILTLITYMGCGVSSCFLGITVLTYTLLEKLRRDYPSKILLNLSLALLGLNLVFLLNSWISSFGIYGLCIAVAATLHYFLLTSCTWMGLGAVNMYFALVKVFNVYVPSYILKFCLLGWGIPLFVCGLVLAINRDAYGMNTMSDSQLTLDDSEMFCWVQNNVVFYVSVVSYVAFILLCNGSIFLVVLIQIRNMQINQPAGTRSGILKDLRAVASLTFLLGLTWSVAFLAWGPVRVFLLYLFSILNSLQGFFIFVFHCLMKENVRKQWRIHLCRGAFKLQEHSEWSQTATMVPKHKPNMLPLMASVRSIKSNSTQSSTVSSESSQRQVTITRPDLGFVYENSLVIPRAKPGLSGVSRDSFPVTASGLEFPSRPWKNGFDPDIYPK